MIIKKLILAFLCVASLYADDGLANPSPRPKTQPKTVDMFVNALYWQTAEAIDWAYTRSGNSTALESTYHTFSFDWAPGFRVGLGYNMEHDQWDSQASFTWFQAHAAASSDGPIIVPGFLAARLSLLEPFVSGKANINLHYNLFDWDVGRLFLVSNHLGLRPSIGMKAGWITQKIHSHWVVVGSILAEENLKHSFKGGGPKGGVTSRWQLGCLNKHSFSLIGTFEAGYLWGHWSIRDGYIDSLLTTISAATTPRSFGSVVLHSFLGLGWEFNFDRDRAHFEFKLGYELEDWFNQLQIFTNINGAQNNDLILQGLTASLLFNF
jgi:hypothetical protein